MKFQFRYFICNVIKLFDLSMLYAICVTKSTTSHAENCLRVAWPATAAACDSACGFISSGAWKCCSSHGAREMLQPISMTHGGRGAPPAARSPHSPINALGWLLLR